MRWNGKTLARGAMIAALYLLLTVLLKPISYGMVQFRISEALTILPVLMPEAVPGLFVGCLLANLAGGAVLWDVVFGSIATLLAALLTRRLRGRPVLAAAMPVLANGLIVGPTIYLCYMLEGEILYGAMAACAGWVALGEAGVCFLLGLPLLKALRRVKNGLLTD